MSKPSAYFALVPIALALILAATGPRVLAQEAPRISSSLAKNLWRQAHFYFDEGMDAKATRACEELLAWARENDEPAIEKKMSEMLAALRARQQAPATVKPAPASPAPAMQTSQPACGYAIGAGPMPVNSTTLKPSSGPIGPPRFEIWPGAMVPRPRARRARTRSWWHSTSPTSTSSTWRADQNSHTASNPAK